MYLLLVTLVFSLALGPDVELLNAAELTSLPSYHSTVSLEVTQSSPGGNNTTKDEETTMSSEEPTTRGLTTTAENVEQTSEESLMMSKLLTTPEPTVILVTPTKASFEVSTQPRQQEETTMTNITTMMPPQTPSPSPDVSDPPALSTTSLVLTPTPEKITDTLPTTMPTTMPMPTTVPTPTTTTMPTTEPTPTTTTTMPTPTTTMPTTVITTSSIFTTQEQTTAIAPDTDISTHPEEISTSVISIENSTHVASSKKEVNWLIIAIIALVVFCILMTLCVGAVIINCRKRSRKQNFGYTNGQRSKKEKGTEDVWAGPVKLGGRDCEDSEDGDVQGQERTRNKADVTGLSTFVTLEKNGGVGRPGSPEVEKWEEQEPLLYIDEEGKGKRKEVGKSEDADTKEETGETDGKGAEPSGGEAFCLTTAV